MNRGTRVTLETLIEQLPRTPVIGTVHPLVPLCLPAGVHITTDPAELVQLSDRPDYCEPLPVLLLSGPHTPPELAGRLPHWHISERPSAKQINEGLPRHLAYARAHLLSTRHIADYIVQDVADNAFDMVVVFLVDGLSYADVADWPCAVQPCFVDGPSVTFRFWQTDKTRLDHTVGFPAIIGRPSIYARLYRLGYHHARGYTYWNRDNRVADYMFEGVPYQKVANFEAVLEQLSTEKYWPHTYVQIVREGLDGLAHNKRELRAQEVQAAIHSILRDVERLSELLCTKGRSGCIYLTADHGILWKTEHPFLRVSAVRTRHPRYGVGSELARAAQDVAVTFRQEGGDYHLFVYPFLGTAIRANDSGVHGGLSYQESFVPLAKFEVK